MRNNNTDCLSVFGEFPTIRVFMGNKATSIIAVKIRDTFFSSSSGHYDTNCELAMSKERHLAWDFKSRARDSENRVPSSCWPWQQPSVARSTALAAPSSSIQGQCQHWTWKPSCCFQQEQHWWLTRLVLWYNTDSSSGFSLFQPIVYVWCLKFHSDSTICLISFQLFALQFPKGYII